MNKFFDSDYYMDETEFSELLAELPMPLVKESIKEQVKDPVSIKVDNMEFVLYKFGIIDQKIGDDSEFRFEFIEFKKKFFLFVIETICAEYDVEVDLDLDNIGEIEEVACGLYEILILRYIKNMEDFYYKYILRSRQMLIEEYGDINNYTEPPTATLKKILDQCQEKPELILVARLASIFKDIGKMTENITSNEFIVTSGVDRTSYGYKLLTLFESGRIVGTFVPDYMDKFFDMYDDLKQEIFNEVRMKLINKFGLL